MSWEVWLRRTTVLGPEEDCRNSHAYLQHPAAYVLGAVTLLR